MSLRDELIQVAIIMRVARNTHVSIEDHLRLRQKHERRVGYDFDSLVSYCVGCGWFTGAGKLDVQSLMFERHLEDVATKLSEHWNADDRF